jgi:hypothetical protein
MATTAILHTPWDCRWGRFARRTTGEGKRGGLWDCVRTGVREPISQTDCESCPFYEYHAPSDALAARNKAASERRRRNARRMPLRTACV